MASRLGAEGDLTLLGLYLHVPFCSRRCDYCDFYVVVGRDDLHERFVDALEREIRARAAGLSEAERAADTIYVGGGTPSLLRPSSIARLVAACREAFLVAPDAEVTLEANPEGIDRERLDGWLGGGVNRLSIGVQTLDDAGLRKRGRLHTAERALRSIGEARRAGFGNVSADLIAGLPDVHGGEESAGAEAVAGRASAVSASSGRSAVGAREPEAAGTFASRFAAGLRSVLAERPDHLSVYLFETDKETPLMRSVREGRERLPEDDEVADAYAETLALTSAVGYEHYEIANFCLPGRRSRHNLKYWTGEPYLGFGPSAHSHFRGRRFSAPRDVDAWMERAIAPGAGGNPASAPDEGRSGAGDLDYTLTGGEGAAREALILNLRLTQGVDLERFDATWGTDSRSWVARGAADALEAGLVTLVGATLKLTDRGMLLANEVFSRLTSA